MNKPPVKFNKLRPPVVPTDALCRPELLCKLQEATLNGFQLSMVCAPFGYGKSVLIAQYVAALKSPWAWLRCEVADNQPLHFLLHLHKSLGLLEFSDSAVLNAGQLWAEISSHFEQQRCFTLVLDDLHYLRSPVCLSYINELLRHVPSGLHVVVASQGLPGIAFNQLRRDGRLQVIDSHQLELASAEIEALAQQRGISISSAVAYQLRTANEGWISGVLIGLAAYSSSAHVSECLEPVVEAQAQRWLAQLFMDEVLCKLPPGDLYTLERLSVLNAWDQELAQLITGSRDSTAIMVRLLAVDLFISYSPDERLPYRLHPQLRLTLYQRLSGRSLKQVHALHLLAADWLLQQQCYSDAMLQLGRARDFKRLLATLEYHSFDLLREGKVNAVMEFIGALPGFSTDDHLTLAITEASVVAVVGDVQRCASCLRRLRQLLKTKVLSEQRLQRSWQTLSFLRSRLAYLGGNYKHGIEVAARALLEYPQNNAATAVLQFNRGSNLLALGKLRLARQDTEQSLVQIESLKFTGYANQLHWQLGLIELAQGQYCHAKARFARLDKVPRGKPGDGFYDLYRLLGQAVLALEVNQPAQADVFLAQAETLAMGFAQGGGLPCVLYYQGCSQLARSKPALARARWDEARRLAFSNSLFGVYRQIGAQRARLAVFERDQDFIMSWLSEWHGCIHRNAEGISTGEWLAYAWVQRHLGQHRVAGKILVQLAEQAELEGDQQLCIELHILSAALHLDQGRRGAALHRLDQALQQAAGEGCGRLLHREGRALEALWRQLLTPAARRQYQLSQPLPAPDQLADLLCELGDQANPHQLLIEPLTRREQDVLRRIGLGQHNQQIADAMFISLSTVKTHINNLFRKLDVQDREGAIQSARRLNLFVEQ
ncbi:LuxR C-terminal-related transcriptional regulator [Ectopseudomonas mendocina]|uniref:LuxR C-terminal-related transcriptional regulator n=1 Tax=Ectopseudomonas mendocina TaxID=300 RepID=A0ABZ2RI92_ECTME